MDEQIWNQVEAILDSGARLSMALTGGGSKLVTWLLNHPGASRAVVEAQIPYHESALQAYLSTPGPHRVEEETARVMALQAFSRTRAFTGGQGHAIGVGCTAALATRRVRRGEDRVCIALRTAGQYRFYALRFEKGTADRLEQEDVLSRFALQVLAEACGAVRESPEAWPAYVDISSQITPVEESLERLLQGEARVVEMGLDGCMVFEVEQQDRLLLSGSFNPLHQGHTELAAAAQAQSGRSICLEISVENVDKPPLSYGEVMRRLGQLEGHYPVVLTRAATFMEKARLFGRGVFVIGYDTAVRLLDASYYEGEEDGLGGGLEEMATGGCRFLVAGRLHEGCYRTLEDIDLPEQYQGMFEAITEAVFRKDISSSEIREKEKPFKNSAL